ncbi:hypothetical protein [Sedimentitalea todarodis]|uniref:Uncharacterized protein n=1 Tax=Sedimentitalea todarodis TaxID=1631240 RepID=A0ABU3VBY4_9RHOB|nr:hypothetical protein [Sedimentitalea todarodis]MDU9003690.1 hypothetical protein [Sedimentitalea todarodis]
MFEALLLMVSVGLQSAVSFSAAGSAVPAAPVPDQVAEEVRAAEPVPTAPPDPPDPASDEPAAESGTVIAQSEETTAPANPAPEAPQLVAEPQTATGKFTTALEVKPILNATRGNWITLREYDGKDLVYVTHLWAWRCGLLEMRVGINGNTPEPWPMPDCHLDQPAPGAILETDGLPYRGYALGSVALIEVQLTYDDLTTAGAKYNRDGRLVE